MLIGIQRDGYSQAFVSVDGQSVRHLIIHGRSSYADRRPTAKLLVLPLA